MKTPVPIISVTGTKGKTTTVAVIADVLQKMGRNVLKVDTTGHFINGHQKSTIEDSKQTWRLVPSVCPGRYLWEFHANPDLKENGVAVLECSLGSSALSGVGYRYHNVGVFLNVFEDHIGSSKRINNKEDIVKAKQFIFERLLTHQTENAYAVFNADDEHVVNALSSVPDSPTVFKIACGIDLTKFDTETHLKSSGIIVTTDSAKNVIVKSTGKELKLFNLSQIPWTFEGSFKPSVYNLLHSVGAIYGYCDTKLPLAEVVKAFESFRLDPYGGRLTLLKTDNDVTILADYAHEKYSLVEVAKLARGMVKEGGSVIGVVRLTYDRTDKLIKDTGEHISKHYDKFVVYDKIDGHWRQPVWFKTTFTQEVGRVSEIFANAIKLNNKNVERIIREDEAIARAAEIAKPGDVVVVIVNDDIKRSIKFIKDSFKADFV